MNTTAQCDRVRAVGMSDVEELLGRQGGLESSFSGRTRQKLFCFCFLEVAWAQTAQPFQARSRRPTVTIPSINFIIRIGGMCTPHQSSRASIKSIVGFRMLQYLAFRGAGDSSYYLLFQGYYLIQYRPDLLPAKLVPRCPSMCWG